MEDAVLNQFASQLKELGLTTHEALTYITLLTHLNISASALCSETKIPDSKIYYALDGLAKKGMLTSQQGNPTLYRANRPEEAIGNLKQQLKSQLDEKIRHADVLISQLAPLFDCTKKPEELEIAYILRGQNSIINRLKILIQNSRKEITLFMTFPKVFGEIHPALREAKEKRRVKLNIAVTPEIGDIQDLSDLGDVKVLYCRLAMFISDMKTLVTVTSWDEEIALMTQDPNLIKACREYFDAPRCCGPKEKATQKGFSLKKQVTC